MVNTFPQLPSSSTDRRHSVSDAAR
jgi:hypothetical protein